MAGENIVLKVGVDASGAETSVKSLKAQMRELRDEMGSHELGSAAFTEAAKKAGVLQEKMLKVKESITDFNPEKKFQAFTTVLEGAAKGMEAAVGASALFGTENKNMEQAILKTQGAMALANGLDGLSGMRDNLKKAGVQIMEHVKSLGTLKGALAATGIGALVLALGVIIANWKEISKVIEDTFPGFKKVEDFFKNIKQIGAGVMASLVESFKVIGEVVSKIFSGDFSGAIASAKTFGERTAEAYNKGFEEKDKEIQLANSIEKRKREIALDEAKGKDVLNRKIKLAEDELKLLEKNSEEYDAKEIEIEKLRTERRKRDADAALKAKMKQWKEDSDFYTELSARLKREEQEKIAARELEARNNKEFADMAKAIDEDSAKSKKEWRKIEEDEKKAVMDTSVSLLNSASEAAGKSTAEGQALAAAATAIATYQAAYAAFNSMVKIPVVGFGLGVAAAAAATLSGMTAIKNIYAVKVPNSSGGGGSAPNISAPSMANVSNTTRLTNGNEPIVTRTLDVKNNKVFVVESDITSKQKTVQNIQNKATIK